MWWTGFAAPRPGRASWRPATDSVTGCFTCARRTCGATTSSISSAASARSGFDAGRIDGIFGPDTDRALRSFQRNAGFGVDGIGGPQTLLSPATAALQGPRDRPGRGPRVRALARNARDAGWATGRARRGGRCQRLPARRAARTRRPGRDRNVVISPGSVDPGRSGQRRGGRGLRRAGPCRARAVACRAAYWGAHGTVSPAGRRLAGLHSRRTVDQRRRHRRTARADGDADPA